MARARFVVHGAVQGVNFRATAVREAMRLAITGRVWNREDGSVELIAEGSGKMPSNQRRPSKSANGL